MPLRTFVYAPILTSTVTNKINVQFAHVCHLITFTNISDTAAKTNFFSVGATWELMFLSVEEQVQFGFMHEARTQFLGYRRVQTVRN